MGQQGRIVEPAHQNISAREKLPDHVHLALHTDRPDSAFRVHEVYDGWGFIPPADRTVGMENSACVVNYGLYVKTGRLVERLRPCNRRYHLLYPTSAPEIISSDRLYEPVQDIPVTYLA